MKYKGKKLKKGGHFEIGTKTRLIESVKKLAKKKYKIKFSGGYAIIQKSYKKIEL